jgi:hypothetical protein
MRRSRRSQARRAPDVDCRRVTESFPVAHLEGYADLPVVRPGLAWYAARLREGRPFAFLKRTHGFWDRCVDVCDASPAFRAFVEANVGRKDDARPGAEEIEAALRITPDMAAALEKLRIFKHFWEGGFFADLVRDLRNPHRSDRWIESISLRAHSRPAERASVHPAPRLREMVLALARRDMTYHDALVFKDAVFTGELVQLMDAVREHEVIAVGPKHIEGLGRAAALPRFRHVRIRATEAIEDREEILGEVRSLLRSWRLRRTSRVVLLQAGTLSWWLAHRLFPDAEDVWFLDMGRVLDIWFPQVAATQPWFTADRDEIVRAMGLGAIHGRATG